GGLEGHGQQVRAHVQALAKKTYWEPLDEAIDLIVLFMPGESFFGAAAEADPALIEDAMGRRVAIAAPMTLVALLRAVELGWREERLAADAQQVTAEGRELYKRVATFLRYFADVGGALGRATNAYNQAAGSLGPRALPAARRLRDLAATPADEAPGLEPVDQTPREIAAPEYPVQQPLESGTPREERETCRAGTLPRRRGRSQPPWYSGHDDSSHPDPGIRNQSPGPSDGRGPGRRSRALSKRLADPLRRGDRARRRIRRGRQRVPRDARAQGHRRVRRVGRRSGGTLLLHRRRGVSRHPARLHHLVLSPRVVPRGPRRRRGDQGRTGLSRRRGADRAHPRARSYSQRHPPRRPDGHRSRRRALYRSLADQAGVRPRGAGGRARAAE